MAVTIRDVAQAAGVSAMAVSKVLHGKGGNVRVSAEKAELIRKMAEELQYTPNNLARSLRGGKTRNLGLLFEHLAPIAYGSRYTAHLLDGIRTAAFAAGYSFTICPQLTDNNYRALADGRFDGVIWAKFSVEADAIQLAQRTNVKFVMLHVPPHVAPESNVVRVCCDNPQALELAVSHLHELGHQVIGFVNEVDSNHNAEAEERTQCFHDSCSKRGIPRQDQLVTVLGENVDKIESWLRANPRMTAVILRSEILAGALYEAAARLGKTIPNDLSVIGFDSTEYCESLTPRLTAISQPIEDMARRAVEILIETIEGKPSASQALIYPCGLDVRESTARPPLIAER